MGVFQNIPLAEEVMLKLTKNGVRYRFSFLSTYEVVAEKEGKAIRFQTITEKARVLQVD